MKISEETQTWAAHWKHILPKHHLSNHCYEMLVDTYFLIFSIVNYYLKYQWITFHSITKTKTDKDQTDLLQIISHYFQFENKFNKIDINSFCSTFVRLHQFQKLQKWAIFKPIQYLISNFSWLIHPVTDTSKNVEIAIWIVTVPSLLSTV